MFVSAPGKVNPNHCGCPELFWPEIFPIEDDCEDRWSWRPHCEVRFDQADDLDDALHFGPNPDPKEWRCPSCTGPIVRVFCEQTGPGQPTAYVESNSASRHQLSAAKLRARDEAAIMKRNAEESAARGDADAPEVAKLAKGMAAACQGRTVVRLGYACRDAAACGWQGWIAFFVEDDDRRIPGELTRHDSMEILLLIGVVRSATDGDGQVCREGNRVYVAVHPDDYRCPECGAGWTGCQHWQAREARWLHQTRRLAAFTDNQHDGN